MQLTETVTIINKSGKIIGNGKHIVSIFKEAKAAYQDKKAAIKAERAAAAAATTDGRPAIRRAQTYDARSRGPESRYYEYDDHVYDVPERRHFLPIEQQSYYTHERYVEEPESIADDGDGDRRRSIDDVRSHASSRRSHRTHKSHRSRTTTATGHGGSRPPLTATNLRTLTEISATTPSQVPRAYRSAYAETATQQQQQQQQLQQYENMALSRPALAHAPYTTPPTAVSRASSVPNLTSLSSGKKKKKEIDMNLAYGNVPPDLATRIDLGPVTAAEEHAARLQEEARKEQEARTLMARIDTLLDEAECVQHSATSIIDHLQRKPEAAAAVALMLAELSTLLKAMSPSFLGVVKGGFPAIFALLASPQFLIGVGVAVGVTVVFFGGWKIVKRIKEAKAIAAEKSEALAFEMQSQQPPARSQYAPSPYPASAPPVAPSAPPSEAHQYGLYGTGGPGSYDDALVLDEELSSIETWRRGIAPSGEDGEEEEELESVDLELITPEAARSVRGDAQSIRTTRTTRTHRSSKSHRSHRSSHSTATSRRHHPNAEEEGGEEEEEEGTVVDVPARRSSSSKVSSPLAARAESVAGTERSHRTSRSKTTVRTELKAIEDGSRDEENTLDMVLRGKDKKSNMLKTLFKKKKDREDAAVSVMA